ncbi:HNH endonuclease [Cytobacillus sp. FSL R5-0569]|uniref:HNH endonuclease n=1 Tax=Cytobacillus sp. FSL R5-0569 TaxID=2921649 RepID=UPI0030F86FCF
MNKSTIKEIPGYSMYLADIERGLIYSKKLVKWLKPTVNDVGYVYNWLVDDNGEGKPVAVHKLIMSAAIEFPIDWWQSKNLEIDHRNKEKCDNNFNNLQLLSKKKNHSFITEKKKSTRLSDEDLKFIIEAFKNWDGKKIEFYKIMAEEFGCVWQTVQYNLKGYTKQSKGLI